MTSKSQMKSHLFAKYGETFSNETFKKAVAKAERWQRSAYGFIDWDEYKLESGVEALDCFYKETLEKIDGRDTFNRGKS